MTRTLIEAAEAVLQAWEAGADMGREAAALRSAVQALRDGGAEPVAYLYHDAQTFKDAHPWLHSTMLVLAADRRPHLRNETPLYATPPTQDAPALTVRLCSFPESNGKRNWTAMFVRKMPWGGLVGSCGGITIAHGELWNRVAYKAECARALIGERDTEPHILDYGDDIHTPEEWAGEKRGGRPIRAPQQGRIPHMSTNDKVPFKPETWPVDADGFAPELCTECGTPVRYGSRHSRCAAPPAPAAGGGEVAHVTETLVGPRLFVHGVEVARWLGCSHDAHAYALAESINRNAALATPTSAPPAEPAAAPGVVEALRKLVAAVQAETSDEWDCNSYHPTLRPALRTAEQVLEAALAAASAPRVAVRLTAGSVDWLANQTAWHSYDQMVALVRAVERASWEANGLKEPT